MDSKKIIKQLMIERGVDINWMAQKMEINPQSVRNKINRGSYSLTDFVDMMDILNCDIQIVTRDSKKIFS